MKNKFVEDFFLIISIIAMMVIIVLALCLLFSVLNVNDPFHRLVLMCGGVNIIYATISCFCDDK